MSAIAQEKYRVATNELTDFHALAIVGTGPVGIQVAKELLKRHPDQSIVIYGNEPWTPYNRVKLSALLAGEIGSPEIDNSITLLNNDRIVQHHNCAIVAIDREKKLVTDCTGREQHYVKLILATGSSPHIPNISGIKLPGVFTFRNMDDAQRLFTRRLRSRRTIVLGGGMLGLEVAKAMLRNNTEVFVVEHSNRLMHRQLDQEAAERLREYLLSQGMRIYLNDGIKKILGDISVTGVQLHSGKVIYCDTVIVATGIRSNTQLALEAGLPIGRGIKVNDFLQTSDPLIYAVGECVEHRGLVYGLVAPGLEQAAIAAHHICGGHAKYHGSNSATHLKVVGRSVFSMGTVGDEIQPGLHRQLSFNEPMEGIYRLLIIRQRKLVGAIALGEWGELTRIQEFITHGRNLWPWQLLRFKRTGNLWPANDAQQVQNWPAKAVVCNCTGVTRGVLTQAISHGCATLEQLSYATRASTVCGSCRPLLSQLMGSSIGVQKIKGKASLAIFSAIAFLAALVIGYTHPIPYFSTVKGWHLDVLWHDAVWKQVSGYTLLGLSLMGLVLSLRKRWKFFSFGDFNLWRVFHTVLGVTMLTVLVVHSGLHLGVNLNFILMLCFLGLSLSGAVSGHVVAMEHRIGIRTAKRLRSGFNWFHLLMFWPLPVLLIFHILSVYYF